MTFRPSVLPDRDNDILSTFTRSFERARQLVRQDQADKRASILFEQGQQDREAQRQDKILDFNLRASETPGVRQVSGDVDPEQLRLQAALGGRAPTLPGTRASGGFVAPQTINIPRDVLDPSTPVLNEDFVDAGIGPDGRRVTTSAALRRSIERQNADDAIAQEERAGAPARARDEQELERARDTIRAMVGAGLLTDAAGNRVELSSLPDNFDPEAISDIIGRQETGRQRILNTTAERPPRAAAPPNPNAVTPEARFQDDLRAQLSRAVNAERSRLATAAENDPNRFNPDFQPQLEPDAQAVERTVLEAMRRTGSQEEISFIDARLAQLGGGGGGGGGGGANPEADQALADAISDADDPAQELQDLGVTGERAARVLALIGG